MVSSREVLGDYYDIDAILAAQERVPVTFTHGVEGFGRAVGGAGAEEDLEAGTSCDLPFWLLPRLAREDLVTVRRPRMFERQVRDELRWDPIRINLNTYSSYFYQFGWRLWRLTGDEDLWQILITAFTGRYAKILTKAFNFLDKNPREFSCKLTQEELRMYEAGQQSSRAFHEWRYGKKGWLTQPQLEASRLVRQGAKRTRPWANRPGFESEDTAIREPHFAAALGIAI